MQFIPRVLCAAILLNSAVAYAGAYPIYDGTAFTFDRSDFDPEFPISIASETATSVSFSLWGLEERLNTSTDSSYRPWSNDYTSTENGFQFAVKDGYKITGIELTGTFTGALTPAPWTMPGDANNHLYLGLGAGGLWDSEGAYDVNGTRTFTLSTGAAALEGEFGMWLSASSESSAASVWYLDELSGEQYWLGSQASAGIANLVMTVNVAPVPEPATYGMLMGGLGVLAVLARRRRG